MDARKIQFLIGIQREIDKLEAKDGNTPKVEKVKSRFYDVVEVEEVADVGNQVKQDIPKATEPLVTIASANIIPESSVIKRKAYTPEQIEDFNKELVHLLRDKESVASSETDEKKTPVVAQVVQSASEEETDSNSKPQPIFPHNPKDVADFMKLFDDSDGLKYLTHEFDEPNRVFEVNIFLGQSKKLFAYYAKKYTIPITLWRVIYEFAFKQEPDWTAEKQITEGWSSSKWIEWSEINGHPLKNRSFEHIVQSFRSYTRIKGTLKNIIESVIESKFKERKDLFNFDFVDLNKADFYTYVGSLKRALQALFDEIYERPEYPNVFIRYERGATGDYRQRIIKIFQEGSYPTNKTLGETLEKYQQSGGHLWEIRKNLFGYCDWNIETLWDDKPLRIHFLKEGMTTNKVDVQVEELESLTQPGFTHTLTFYFR